MQYRKIGNTGMSSSIIGFGGEHLDGKPYADVQDTVNAAMENGIDMLDIFMPGDEIRSNFGRAIKGNRDKFLIQGHIGSTDVNQQYDISRDLPTCRKYFEKLLRNLQTDYIDVGMLFFIDSEQDFQAIFDSEIITYVQKLKQQGTIRAIGASSHNPLIAKKVVETGVVELLMFSINPAFDMLPVDTSVFDVMEHPEASKDAFRGIRPDRLELYQLCQQRDVAITVMKTLGAGKLLSKEHTPFNRPLTVQQCIHYALTRPAVVSTMLGFKSRDEVLEAVRYLDMTDSERDYTHVVNSMQNNFDGHCVYCSHCQPCPVGIDIAALNKYLDIAKLDQQNVPPSIRQHYGSMTSHGSDCIQCGNCESRCPFSVPIIKNMEEAASVFGE